MWDDNLQTYYTCVAKIGEDKRGKCRRANNEMMVVSTCVSVGELTTLDADRLEVTLDWILVCNCRTSLCAQQARSYGTGWLRASLDETTSGRDLKRSNILETTGTE